MPATKFSPAFDESVRLLLELHDLMSAGNSSTSEADERRSRMERPWYEMNEEEQELFEGLSTDLYSIGQPRIVKGLVADMQAAEFQEFIVQKRWNHALKFLRRFESQLPPDDVACIRG